MSPGQEPAWPVTEAYSSSATSRPDGAGAAAAYVVSVGCGGLGTGTTSALILSSAASGC